MIICIDFVIIVQNTPNLAVFKVFDIEKSKVYLDAKVIRFKII